MNMIAARPPARNPEDCPDNPAHARRTDCRARPRFTMAGATGGHRYGVEQFSARDRPVDPGALPARRLREGGRPAGRRPGRIRSADSRGGTARPGLSGTLRESPERLLAATDSRRGHADPARSAQSRRFYAAGAGGAGVPDRSDFRPRRSAPDLQGGIAAARHPRRAPGHRHWRAFHRNDSRPGTQSAPRGVVCSGQRRAVARLLSRRRVDCGGVSRCAGRRRSTPRRRSRDLCARPLARGAGIVGNDQRRIANPCRERRHRWAHHCRRLALADTALHRSGQAVASGAAGAERRTPRGGRLRCGNSVHAGGAIRHCGVAADTRRAAPRLDLRSRRAPPCGGVAPGGARRARRLDARPAAPLHGRHASGTARHPRRATPVRHRPAQRGCRADTRTPVGLRGARDGHDGVAPRSPPPRRLPSGACRRPRVFAEPVGPPVGARARPTRRPRAA